MTAATFSALASRIGGASAAPRRSIRFSGSGRQRSCGPRRPAAVTRRAASARAPRRRAPRSLLASGRPQLGPSLARSRAARPGPGPTRAGAGQPRQHWGLDHPAQGGRAAPGAGRRAGAPHRSAVRTLGHHPGHVVVGEPGMVPRGRRVEVGLHAGDGVRQTWTSMAAAFMPASRCSVNSGSLPAAPTAKFRLSTISVPPPASRSPVPVVST